MTIRARSVITLKITRELSTAQETWLCDWEEALFASFQFVGGWLKDPDTGDMYWYPPANFTEMPELRCTACEVKPLGDMIPTPGSMGDDTEEEEAEDSEEEDQEEEDASNADDEPGDEDPDADEGTYKTALLTVDYGLLKPSEENEDPKQIYESHISFGGEGLQFSGKDHYTWNEGIMIGQKVAEDIYLTKIIPSMEINCKYRYRETLPVDIINSCNGVINSATMNIAGKPFYAGQVLFLGGAAEPTQSTDGENGWSRELKFLVKDSGWNNLWNPDTQLFEGVSPPLYGDDSEIDGGLMSLFEE